MKSLSFGILIIFLIFMLSSVRAKLDSKYEETRDATNTNKNVHHRKHKNLNENWNEETKKESSHYRINQKVHKIKETSEKNDNKHKNSQHNKKLNNSKHNHKVSKINSDYHVVKSTKTKILIEKPKATKKTTEIKETTNLTSPKLDTKVTSKINEQQENKNENNNSGGNHYILYGTAALIVAAVGGATYRNQVKKNMINSKDCYEYSYQNNTMFKEKNNKVAYPDQTFSNNYLIYNNNANNKKYTYINNNNDYNTEKSISSDTEVLFENEEEKLNVVTLPTNHAYKAVLPWNPRCVDEIQLNCGDLVCVKECYQDGYSLGRNLTSRFDGIFPTCCLASIGSKIDEEKVNKWVGVGMYSLPKRSIKPTKKAKRASRGISLLTLPDWSKKLESLKLESP